MPYKNQVVYMMNYKNNDRTIIIFIIVILEWNYY